MIHLVEFESLFDLNKKENSQYWSSDSIHFSVLGKNLINCHIIKLKYLFSTFDNSYNFIQLIKTNGFFAYIF